VVSPLPEVTYQMRIHAAVLRERTGPLRVEELELDEPEPGEALVRIVGTGVCRTDFVPRHRDVFPVPIVPGHEGAGVVEAVGPAVGRMAVGDHVVLSFDSCGWCPRCRGGEPSHCDDFFSRNLFGRRSDGSTALTDSRGDPVMGRWFGQSSFATHSVATERNMVVVDRSLPLELMAPLGCGIQTGAGAVFVGMAVGAGSSIVIFGTGAVGLAAVMAARVAGASEIIAVDLQAKRRELALELGATRTIDGADPDIGALVTDWTGGADFALDTTGIPQVVTTALISLHTRGVCGLVGSGVENLVIPPRALMTGRTLRYLMEGDADPQRLIPTLAALWQKGRFPFDRLIRTYALDAVDTAEQDSTSGATVKPVLLPTG
jgi:aryl-alcohol dehydrogenase